ncbi:MAG: hypothetical protein M0R74_18280 [Dehalococcoidia bacterium]|nr:hypothetical protein [Dehalococcoidia bacterium]
MAKYTHNVLWVLVDVTTPEPTLSVAKTQAAVVKILTNRQAHGDIYGFEFQDEVIRAVDKSGKLLVKAQPFEL